MNSDISTNLRALGPGIILALLAILFGFLLGGALGAAEDVIKDQLRVSANSVLDTVYHGDEAAKDAVVGKSWAYMKRAHLHGGGIGAAALACIILMALMGPPGLPQKVTAGAFGAGALLYPIFWLAAGFTAPSLGGTDAAKEALSYLALPGAGLCLIGILGALYSAIVRLVAPAKG